MPAQRINLLDHDREGLRNIFTGLGEKSFRADQILKWIHGRGELDFERMTDLGKALRERLGKIAQVSLPLVRRDLISTDGTRKWLLELADGNCIEAVFIPEIDRGTLCVSSQVGCALNCSFCATGRQGYNRNLTTGEIIAQVWLAERMLNESDDGPCRISNVVLMGMGEPLLNFDNVVRALRLMLDDMTYGLSKRRVTLSTAGVVPGIDQLRQACPVSLAVSLHAPNDDLRSELVPLNRKYPIERLIAACRRYVANQPRRRVTFEYAMLKGVNDSLPLARELVRVLKGVPAKVNLIPFNSFSGCGYARSDAETIDQFRNVLHSAGIVTITRKTRGDDIDAACGQLAGDFRDRTRRSLRYQQAATHVH